MAGCVHSFETWFLWEGGGGGRGGYEAKVDLRVCWGACWLTRTIYIYEYCFSLLSAQSWQYRDRRKPEAGSMPYSYFEWLFLVYSTIGSTVHSMPLNSLAHCICTTTMTNIRPDRDSNLVPPGYKPQSIRMSHRGRPRGKDTRFVAKTPVTIFKTAQLVS